MELRLYLDAENPLIFVEPNVAPADAENARAWLADFGTLLLVARTGQYKGSFSNQNASMSVQLDNTDGKCARLIGQAIRVRAELYQGATLYFAGLVQTITYGPKLALDIGA